MGLGCPLGLEFCEQKLVSLDAKCYAINCENYFHCRSWVLPWSIPLHRMKANPGAINPVPHDYYLVEFLCGYGYPRESYEGMQERDWAAYFAEYGYAEAVPLPRYDRINYKLFRIPFTFTLSNGMIIIMAFFGALIRRG
jgi:hypothetical protein